MRLARDVERQEMVSAHIRFGDMTDKLSTGFHIEACSGFALFCKNSDAFFDDYENFKRNKI